MNSAKIHLSPEELELAANAQWLLTKNNIIGKTYELFGLLAQELRHQIDSEKIGLPFEVLLASPKISKGENYRGLPWVMLDYPRSFGKDDVFALRTMFWWGNFISVTLHLKGRYLRSFVPVIERNSTVLIENAFYVAMGEDEWRHDFENDNYKLIDRKDFITAENILTSGSFCKISSKMSVQEWNNAHQRLWQTYQYLFQIIGYQLPRR